MGVISLPTFIVLLLYSIQASAEDIADDFEDFVNKKFRNEQTQFEYLTPQFQYGNPFFSNPFLSNPFNLFNNFGANIAADINRKLSPLRNLGASIEAQVHKQLEPVRALDIQSKMAKGFGGTTVIIYTSPKPVKLLVKNGKTHICQDNQIDDTPMCNSQKLFFINKKEDYCYSLTFARGNDNMCIANSPEASLSVVMINNKFSCNTDGDHEILVIKISEYEKLCGRDPWDETFTYYPDNFNPMAVKIPSDNPYVSCTITKNGGCSFKGEAIYGKKFESGGSNVNIVQTF